MDSTVAPVVRAITVAVEPATAFEVFTARMGTWWPLDTHSVFGEDAVDAIVEPRVGGRVYEVASDGREFEWGTVIEWEPGYRLAMAWKPNDRPHEPTTVEVTFTEVGDGTRVELVHSGWERVGTAEDAAEARKSYDTGWVPTLQLFAEATRTSKHEP